MKVYHLLNGDCLAQQLTQSKLSQPFIICRECLMDGNVMAENMNDFWATRAKFITATYSETFEKYFEKTVKEFDKILHLAPNSELCLWFENDLFCQVNMWFVISLLENRPDIQLYRVFPLIKNKTDIWKGFAIASAETLEHAYEARIAFSKSDIRLGTQLWKAFQTSSFDKLQTLASQTSPCFQYLKEVCEAHIQRFPRDGSLGKPEKVIQELLMLPDISFEDLFESFSTKLGVYGFGDLQVKKMYEKLIQT